MVSMIKYFYLWCWFWPRLGPLWSWSWLWLDRGDLVPITSTYPFSTNWANIFHRSERAVTDRYLKLLSLLGHILTFELKRQHYWCLICKSAFSFAFSMDLIIFHSEMAPIHKCKKKVWVWKTFHLHILIQRSQKQ